MSDKQRASFHVRREQWLQRIDKELKGKPRAALNWPIAPDWQVTPLYDVSAQDSVFLQAETSWRIADSIQVGEDVRKANEYILKALVGGSNALRLHLPADFNYFAELLKGVHLDWIHTYLYCSDEGQTAQYFAAYCADSGVSPSDIAGGIFHENVLTEEQIKQVQRQLPALRMHLAEGSVDVDASEIPAVLANMLSVCIAVADTRSFAEVTNRIQFELALGNNFLLNVASLRAIRLLFANLHHAYSNQKLAAMPPVAVRIANTALTEDPYENMIRIPIIALSAACGGCDLMYLPPADLHSKEQLTYTHKLSRDVQHILQLESHVHEVVNPTAGSYYFDQLTHQIAERSWALISE